VKIGSVTDIKLRFEGDDLSPRIPVYIELEPSRISEARGVKGFKKAVKESEIQERIDKMVKHGLRATLGLQSIVTGQLMVEFDFHPDKPLRLVGVDPEHPEIPTIRSSLEELTTTIEKLPLEQIVNDILMTIKGIEDVVNAPELRDSIANLDKTMEGIRELVETLNNQVTPVGSNLETLVQDVRNLVQNVNAELKSIVSSIESTSQAVNSALRQAEKTLALEEGIPGQIASSFIDTSKAVHDTLEQTNKTLDLIESTAVEDSPLYNELKDALKELTKAARSFRVMMDYLEQHPEALIHGKADSGGN
jgi:paraquat-inducible protein B